MMEEESDFQGSADDVLYNLPPSAKLVVVVLRYEGELTQKELIEKTFLSGRTVRAATTKLEEAGVVTSQICLRDARQKIYSLDKELHLRDLSG